MENYLALLKEYLNINFILQVKAAYQKNIFKAYIPHQNRYVPQDALEFMLLTTWHQVTELCFQ